MVQVKRIISMNKIQSAGKAHHQMLEKGGTYTLYNTLARYFMLSMNCTCLYLYSIQLEMLCAFPVKSPPGCKISLYLHSSLFAINVDIGTE